MRAFAPMSQIATSQGRIHDLSYFRRVIIKSHFYEIQSVESRTIQA
jgi:hypothetical protein